MRLDDDQLNELAQLVAAELFRLQQAQERRKALPATEADLKGMTLADWYMLVGGLKSRIANALAGANIYPANLGETTTLQLLAINGIGPRAINELYDMLRAV